MLDLKSLFVLKSRLRLDMVINIKYVLRGGVSKMDDYSHDGVLTVFKRTKTDEHIWHISQP